MVVQKEEISPSTVQQEPKQHYSDFLLNIIDTVRLLMSLGFTIHADLFSLFQHKNSFLGICHTVNRRKMTLTLTKEKKKEIKELCQ